MIRIDSNTVELTRFEAIAKNHFDGLLDEGLSVIAAANQTEGLFFSRRIRPTDAGFLAWLRS